MPDKFIVQPKSSDVKHDKAAVVSVRLERELLEKYGEVAAKSKRSRNEVICMALRYAIDNLEFNSSEEQSAQEP